MGHASTLFKYVSTRRGSAQSPLAMHRTIELQPATAIDTRLAFEEVKDFGVTDMGRGDSHRYAYRILQEPALTEELHRLAKPFSMGGVDSVTLQPCKLHEARSQDRYNVQTWTNLGGSWTFAAILDGTFIIIIILDRTFVLTENQYHVAGHMNHDTVDFVSRKLCEIVHKYLDTHCQASSALSPAGVSDVLLSAIQSVEHAIMSDFLNLFPGGESFLIHASSAQLRQSINDVEGDETRHTKIARVLGGTTVLIALFNENIDGLWVASLGDSCAGSSACRSYGLQN